MKRRDYEDYIRDIHDSICDIEEFTANLDLSGFMKDKKTVLAVTRSLEIIGEAVKKVPPEIRNKYDEIAWKAIAGMRNKLIHEYFGTDAEILWETIKDDIPQLKTTIIRILEELK